MITPKERFLRAAAGKSVDRPPVWLMRQAGRYLPEYRAVKGSFEQRVATPELAADITLQPLRRFLLDAAVLFSDILVPLAGMGRPARFTDDGPVVDRPVRMPEDVASLREADPTRDMGFVYDSVQRVRKEIPDHALLGFAGAPFTLAAYLVEGASGKSFQETKRFCYHYPDAWHDLMELCARVANGHLRAQLAAGCDAVQLFDTWAEALAPSEYEAYALPYVHKALRGLGPAPTIYFARGTAHLLPLLPRTGARVWSTDWRVQLEDVRAQHPAQPLQGNLDPTLLFAPRATLVEETRTMLDALQGKAHIANLGHGILPDTPIESVSAFVETVTAWTPR